MISLRLKKLLLLIVIGLSNMQIRASFEQDMLKAFGIGITIVGVGFTGIGVATLLEEEKEEQGKQDIIIDFSSSSSFCNNALIINCDLKSKTAKGTICAALGMAALGAGAYIFVH